MSCCKQPTDPNTPCCEPASATATTTASADAVRDRVRAGYREIALTNILGTESMPTGGGCCGTQSPGKLAASIGYSEDELRALPEGANLGLSCGNPTAIAALTPGQTVLDLGSGAGFDCFLAGPKVGANGRVIGVDMTPEMLARARKNLPRYTEATGLNNVEFRLGEIEHLPVADASVDVVISNCVINLSPDKPRVFREIARVLRPSGGGGKVAASDLALLKPLPAAVLEMVEALVGCVAGAVLLGEYERMVKDAGLVDVRVVAKPEYVAALQSFQDPLYARIQASLPAGAAIADYVASIDVTARKA